MNITAREANKKTIEYEDGVGINFFKLVEEEVAKEMINVEKVIQSELKTKKNTKYYINFPDTLLENGCRYFLAFICAELTNAGFDIELYTFGNLLIYLNINWEENRYFGYFKMEEHMEISNFGIFLIEKYNEAKNTIRMRDMDNIY